MNLYGVDLNLLVALDALLSKRNVTRAAKQIGLTQPSMSNALKRLRGLFGDPLFVRGAQGLEPTPRAAALQGPLAAALARLHDDVLTTKVFDPLTATNHFRWAAHDYEQQVILPELTRRLARDAPRVRLEVMIPRERVPYEDLARGRVDLATGIYDATHAGLYRAELFKENFVCALAKNHPYSAANLTLARYTEMPHLLISPFGGMSGTVDEALGKLGVARVVKIAVPQFAIAPFILLDSPYVLTLPERVAQTFAAHLPLILKAPPLALPGFTEHTFWHERTNSDPAHRWFRALVKSVAMGTAAPAGNLSSKLKPRAQPKPGR